VEWLRVSTTTQAQREMTFSAAREAAADATGVTAGMRRVAAIGVYSKLESSSSARRVFLQKCARASVLNPPPEQWLQLEGVASARAEVRIGDDGARGLHP